MPLRWGPSLSTDSACPSCGGQLPEEARFCPRCGSRLGDEEEPETSSSTVRLRSRRQSAGSSGSRRRVRSSSSRSWHLRSRSTACRPDGGSRLGYSRIVSAGLAMLFVETARRLPDGRLARTALDLTDRARGRAGFVWVSLSSWSNAGRETVRLRSLQRRLRREQTALIAELGKEVYRGDDTRAEELKAEARALGERVEECSVQLHSALEAARTRVGRERMGIQPTQALVGEHARERRQPEARRVSPSKQAVVRYRIERPLGRGGHGHRLPRPRRRRSSGPSP